MDTPTAADEHGEDEDVEDVGPLSLPDADADQDEEILPPADANDWTDEQWIAWLAATDANPDTDAEEEADTEAEPTFGKRVTGSIGGQLLAGGMLGMANAIYGKQDEQIGVVQPAADEDDDDPLQVILDLEFPERSVAIIRSPRQQDEHPSAGSDETDEADEPK